MNHMGVSGNVQQVLVHDNGDFLTSGEVRFRKDLCTAYMKHYDPEKQKCVGVKFLIGNGWLIADHDGDEACEKEIQRVDWIYKKDSTNPKEPAQNLTLTE